MLTKGCNDESVDDDLGIVGGADCRLGVRGAVGAHAARGVDIRIHRAFGLFGVCAYFRQVYFIARAKLDRCRLGIFAIIRICVDWHDAAEQ